MSTNKITLPCGHTTLRLDHERPEWCITCERLDDALEAGIVRKHGLGKRQTRPARMTLLVLAGLILSLACQAHAQEPDRCQVGAFTGQGPAGCGIMLGSRAYMPGLVLTRDLALYVGDSEEPATWTMCLQHAHGVVCQGVTP